MLHIHLNYIAGSLLQTHNAEFKARMKVILIGIRSLNLRTEEPPKIEKRRNSQIIFIISHNIRVHRLYTMPHSNRICPSKLPAA
ncbi:hypothetical protein VIGAN_11241000 [Vigna angularis var. angularis]|uniref:Uncharacterized protein n=1 Tax=Vigna angularis var. angularis TaxID=157739 RepID=A0A0S3TCQ0_PHAAN|nr:hypothetical protein VIGAN_11241000 [Vigna angularis var. angularis]